MKTKLVYVFSVCTVAAFIVFTSVKSNRTAVMDIALYNIEAMADSGEEGVKTARCGKNLTPTATDAFHYKCNSSTTTSVMYKCPGVVHKGDINEFEGTFRCML